MKKIEILDTTLRDGNYAIDFQFTARDTAVIALALEKAGFEWIEIGHGLGLNASHEKKGMAAAATDREYLEAARNVLRRARYGMFFIPGIAKASDIKKAADLGASFIRIGTNADKVDEAGKYIALAKKSGLTVFSNLMKSYALKPNELAAKALMAEDAGADIICIVDSAGGMLPEDIERYFNAMREAVKIKLGFHGHNNLSLAVANTLRAIDCGASIVDASLQGIGRSGGNAPTETLATILKRKNMLLPQIDIGKTLDIGLKFVQPFFHKYGIDPIDITLGYAQFHSSFMAKVSKAAREYGVDERELVLAVSAKDRLSPSDKLIKGEAKRLKEKGHPRTTPKFEIKKLVVGSSNITSGRKRVLSEVIKEIHSVSKRTGKAGILNVVFSEDLKNKAMRVSPFIQEGFSYIVGTCEASNTSHIMDMARKADGNVDYILLDSRCPTKIQGPVIKIILRHLKKSTLLLYNDYRAWISTVAREVAHLAKDPTRLRVAVLGDITYTLNTAIMLAEMASQVTLHVDRENCSIVTYDALRPLVRRGMRLKLEQDPMKCCAGKDVLVGFNPGRRVITKDMAARMRRGGIIIDAGLGSVSKEVIPYAYKNGLKVIRVDMGPIIAGEITSSIGIRQLIEDHLGKRRIDGTVVVSGGYVGRKGDIVVDSVKSPTRVIGVARGDSTVQYKDLSRYADEIEKIEKEIFRDRVLLKA